MMRTLQERWRARRRQRGSVALELLVVMPVLALQLGASYWTWHLYENKVAAMKAARGPVFAAALSGCDRRVEGSFEAEGDAALGFTEEEASAVLAEVEGADLGVIGRRLPAAPGAALLDRTVDARGARSGRTVVSDGLVAAPTVNLSGRATMTCNETVRDGDAMGMKRLSTRVFDPRLP
jgi:hypothetical protein